jgi:hypothetical protein
LQRYGLQRALEKADVAKAPDQFPPKFGKPRTFIVIGQDDKGLVRPRRLTAHPVLQQADVIAVQSLLCHQHRLDDAFQIVHHFPCSVADHGTQADSFDQAGNSGGVTTDGHQDQDHAFWHLNLAHRPEASKVPPPLCKPACP